MADFDEPEIQIIPGNKPRGLSRGRSLQSDVSRSEEFVKNVNFFHQFVALFLKDLSAQSKSIVTNLCQILVPIVLISFTGIIQVVMNYLLHKNSALTPGSDSLPIPINVGRAVPCFKDDFTEHPWGCYDPIINYVLDFDFEKWESVLNDTGSTSADLLLNISSITPLSHFIGILPKQNILFDLPYYYLGKDPSVNWTDFDELQNLMVPAKWRYNFSLNFSVNPDYTNRSFLLNETESMEYNGHDVRLPFFLPIEGNDLKLLQKHLLQVVRNYSSLADSSSAAQDQYNRNYYATPLSQAQYNATIDNVMHRRFNLTKPHGGIYFTRFTESSDSLDVSYTIIDNELTLYEILGIPNSSNSSNSSNSFNSFNGTSGPLSNLTTDTELQRRSNMINMIHNGILKLMLNETGVPEEPSIVTYVMPLPPNNEKLTIDITNLLGGVLFPFAASFLFPIFIAALVKDKHERHLIMMEQNGLQRTTYWVITYIFNYLLYVLIAVVITVVSLIWQIRLFTQTSPLVVFIVLWLWGHAQVVLGFFFANFFNSPRTATIIGYILVIAGVMVALLLELLQVFADDKTPFPLYMMFPPFAFYRCLFYMISACGNYQCYGTSVLSASNGLNLLTTGLLYLGVSTIVLLFISFYLSYVLPSEYGVRKNPFFPIIALYQGVMYLIRKCSGGKPANELGVAESGKSSVNVDAEIMDEDVLAEDKRLGQEFPPDSPVVIYRLRKEYPSTGGRPPHVAVKSISLAINRNECFGLLGPNGAGKTTLISVLTGMYEPTNGVARIAGYNLLTEMSSIHRHLGVCPQFDIQYPDLTCEEHLLFYARLKGARIGKAGKIVKRALKNVNLLEAKGKRSKNLSGGMRRRLSVAMACIGNPDILILDEPTTGLDPASRRQVWEVIENIKVDRSVILTTHAMEEADYLCTRIGIMNFGRLCCIGSQSHLKNKFGTGYELKFHCAQGKANNIERFVQTKLSGAVHIETYADTCLYRMDKDKVVVSELFELLDSVRDQIGIVDWGIKMTTLEDVFLNIVRNYGISESSDTVDSYCPTWLPCKCLTVDNSS